MNRILSIIIVYFFAVAPIYAQSLNSPLITINESVTNYAPVDEIHFNFTILSYAKEIQDARNQNKDIATKVFKYLSEKGIPKEFIQTKSMRITRNYIRNRQPREYDGFYALQQVYVCLKDIDLYDIILDELLTMDIEQISGPQFKSSKYEEILKSARLEALKKARTSAEEMATVLGQNIGPAKLISTTYSNPSNSAYSTNSGQGSSNQSNQASFEIGEIEIRATVNVSFELLE